MKKFLKQFSFKENQEEFKKALILTLVLGAVSLGAFALAQSVTLSVTVATSLTFTTANSGFANATTTITPGTPLYATTTLNVATNDSLGWNVTLSGGNKSTGNNNLQTTGNTASIPDQTEWIPGAATTTAGNATTTANFVSSGNVLAFRVMSASSTNGTPFLATAWWGANDAASALWAGIASSSVLRQIGNAGSGSYSASTHVNTVQYYLNVASTQQTGTYSAPLTYTATGN